MGTPVDNETEMAVIAPKKTPVPRDVQRARERVARERRSANLKRMQDQSDTLECAALVVHTLGDDDAVWEDFLDENAIRVRRFLSKMEHLAREAAVLRQEQLQLQRLMYEHQLLVRVVANVHQPRLKNDWEWNVERWRDIAREHFHPWAMAECQDEIGVTIKESNAFRWSADKLTSGLTFLGWRDHQRVDPVRGVFQFQFDKTHRGFDLTEYVESVWKSQTHEPTYNEVTLGDTLSSSLEVMQELDANTWIMRSVRRYPDMDAHMVFLVFRLSTARGFTLCVRSLCCPELIKAINGPRDMWASILTWFQWEAIDNEERAFKLRIGGSVGGTEINYLNEWMVTMFGCVLRSERLATKRQLITSD